MAIKKVAGWIQESDLERLMLEINRWFFLDREECEQVAEVAKDEAAVVYCEVQAHILGGDSLLAFKGEEVKGE